MSRFNSVPVAVQQMIESLRDPKTPANVKFNQAQVLVSVRDSCDLALKQWEAEQRKTRR